VKCRTAIKVLFLYLNLCVMLDSLSCSFTSYSFLLIVFLSQTGFTLNLGQDMIDLVQRSFLASKGWGLIYYHFCDYSWLFFRKEVKFDFRLYHFFHSGVFLSYGPWFSEKFLFTLAGNGGIHVICTHCPILYSKWINCFLLFGGVESTQVYSWTGQRPY